MGCSLSLSWNTKQRHRGLMHQAKTFTCFVVLSYAFFFFRAAYGLCTTNGMQNPPEYDACASFWEIYNLELSDSVVGDTSLGYGSPTICNSFESVCPNTHSFCFPSTLSGLNRKEKSLKADSFRGDQDGGPFCVGLAQDATNRSSLSDYGMFKLINGGVVSCSLNSRDGFSDLPALQTEGCSKDDRSFCVGSFFKQTTTSPSWSKNSEMAKSSSFDGSFTPSVRIDPTVLDWGQRYLYSPSVAFLTVVNTYNDSILTLYEPFSNDLQFYSCNSSEVSLGPGESASICFVFFPRCLGLSSAHLILQTSSGGFIVEAKGYASESPFGIQPLLALEISRSGRLSKKFSLFNPFDETLYVEDITAWVSVSLGHNSVENEATCGIHNPRVSDSLLFTTIKDRLVVKSSQIGSPTVAIKPHRNWEIGPHSSEILLDIDIAGGFEGKVFGAFCLRLLRHTQGKSDTIMVPIEAEMGSHFDYDTAGIFVSATLDGLVACDGGETVITISLRNHASRVLSFVKMLEVSDNKFFHMKYTGGLLLFPGTVMKVGVIYCSYLNVNLHDMPPSNLLENCKLVILTNDSTSPEIDIPCMDILHICFEHQRLSSVGEQDNSKLIKSGHIREGHEVRNSRLLSNVKVIETADVDELVLGNWVSQGTTGGMSVLQDQEVLFPMVQVGSYVSNWITVKNPSQHPVIMQLILNSGEIINECSGPDDLSFPSLSGNLVVDEATTPKKHGFSVPESAVTEAYVQPYDNATLGPVIFYPSKRCQWSGSALIRNNVSGVEWIPLKGFGGLLSLALLERSVHVRSVNFDVKMPKPLNFSLPYALLHMKDISSACSRPSMKEVYAKNTGDLPLEVKTIRVGGRDCGLDGFKIHTCTGFALEPGELKKLTISYQTDFTAAMVRHDLELALATGIILIPMKAIFPFDALNSCKKSLFWMQAKKSLLGFLFIAFLLFLVFCLIFPQTEPLESLDNLCKSDTDNSINTIKHGGKTAVLHCNHRKSKLSVFGKMNHLFGSVDQDAASTKQPLQQCSLSQHLMQTSENHKESNHLLDSPDERNLPAVAVQSSDTTKASQAGNLVVNTGKEKGGRRRRRKSHSGKRTAPSEVSSSLSGNSTPSSPISPVTSASTKCNWPLSPDVEQPLTEARSLITPAAAAQHYPKYHASTSPAKTKMWKLECCGNNNAAATPQVSNSASVSAASIPDEILSSGGPFSPLSVSVPRVFARAPGSNLVKQKAVEDEHRYDIWGVHLSGLHLLAPKDVTCIMKSSPPGNFDSFFVEGPPNIVTKSQEGY